MEKPVILETKDVSLWYSQQGDGQKVVVLDRINLTIREREFIALLGPSGSGKTTFIRIISGLLKPNEGKVIYHGKPLEGINPGVGIVFQSFALFPWLTVVENVMMGLLASGIDRKLAYEKAVKTIDMVGLDGFEEAMPRELSGGMKQRVGIARALVMEPEILCMDEPFSGLDVLTADNLMGEVMDLWISGEMPIRSILMVTHSIEEAVSMADRVVILWRNPGRVAAEVPISLSLPRDPKNPAFKKIADKIYTVLSRPAELVSQGKIRPLALRKFQMLPHVRIGAMTGLLEIVQDMGGKVDIYELEDELGMEADDLLPLTEAVTILGLAEVSEGDIGLTELGTRFVNGDIQERKMIFRDAVANNVVLVNQILQALSASKKNRIEADFFLETLENHFTEEEAERQLETAIDWGRYAELFAYDEDSGIIYLEEEGGEEVNGGD